MPVAWRRWDTPCCSTRSPRRRSRWWNQAYRKDPEHELGERVILEALEALDRPIEDYPWLRPPRVVKLDAELLNELQRSLKPKRKPLEFHLLWFEYECRGYPPFTEEELLRALENDGRFVLSAHPILDQRGISLRR